MPESPNAMLRTLSFLCVAVATFASVEAFATVTLLPGSSPQRVLVGQPLSPIAVRVTNDAGLPVASARVQASFPMDLGVKPDSLAGCFYDLAYICNEGTTDGDGIAYIRSSRATIAKAAPQRVGANASIDGVTFGSAAAEVTIVPAVASMKLTVVTGEGQQAPVGAVFARPFVARVADANGAPMAGVPVIFTRADGPSFEFVGNPEGTGLSDSNGNASSPLIVATMGIGPGIVRATVFDQAANAYVSADFAFRTTTPDGRTDRELEDMWWSGFQENGWGISIAQREDRLFPVIYAYDNNGNPTWQVLATGGWASNTRYERYFAFRYSPRGSPYYAYDVSRFAVGPMGLGVDFNFTSEVSATMELTTGSPTPSLGKKLVRQDFRGSTPAPLVGIGGMWWGGPSQAGWGIALMQQYGGLFAVWFTYDANGDRTWFVMPEGRWENANTYSGPLYKTKSSPWFDSVYDPSKLQVFSVGTFRFRFSDLDHGSFEYSAEGHAGSMAIERQLF